MNEFLKYFVLFSLMFMTFGCSNETKQELAPITVKLSWLHTAEFAGLYTADSLGYYEEEGLDVTLDAFDFEKTAIDYVSDGQAQFGFGSSTEVILAREQNKSVKAVFALYQTSPDVLLSLDESKITKPEDLQGKKIGLSCGSNTEYQEIAFLKKFNITYTSTCSGYDINQLLNGDADAIGGFITNEPILFEEKGYKINKMLISDYGVDVYPNLIFVSEDYMESNPDIILKFLRATKKGLEYSLAHTNNALNFTISMDSSLDVNHQKKTLLVQAPLIHSGISPIGWMDKPKWMETQQLLLDQNMITIPVNPEEAYTMEFLNKIYN